MRFFRLRYVWLLLLPILLRSLTEENYNTIAEQAVQEWHRAQKLVKESNQFGTDEEGHGIHRLKEALYCCMRARDLLNTVELDIAKQPIRTRKKKSIHLILEDCKKSKEIVENYIAQLQQLITISIDMVNERKAMSYYYEGLKYEKKAIAKWEQGAKSPLLHIEQYIAHLHEIAALYQQAWEFSEKALKFIKELSKDALPRGATIFTLVKNRQKKAVDYLEKEALAWPQKALKEKHSIYNRLTILLQEAEKLLA